MHRHLDYDATTATSHLRRGTSRADAAHAQRLHQRGSGGQRLPALDRVEHPL